MESLDVPPDDNWGYYKTAFDALTLEEMKEWKRQYAIIEPTIPVYGSFWAAVEAFEAANPEAL